MQIVSLDPQKLVVPQTRMTSDMDEETWSEFLNSIRTYGIREPIIVVPEGGQYVIIDGLHRAVAAQQLQLKEIPAIVKEGLASDVLLENIVVNRLRGKSKPSEMVACIRELQEQHSVSVDDIQRITGFSAGHLRKLIIIAGGAPELRKALDEGKISVEAAFRIAKYADKLLQERVVITSISYRWGTDEILRYCESVDEELAKPVEAQKPLEMLQPRGIPCTICAGEHNPYDMRSPMLCVECWGLAQALISQAKNTISQAQAP